MRPNIDLVLDHITPKMSEKIKQFFPELKGRFDKLYYEYNTNTYQKVAERSLVLILKNPPDAIYGYSSLDWFVGSFDCNIEYQIIRSTYDDLIKNISDYLKLPYIDRKMRVIA